MLTTSLIMWPGRISGRMLRLMKLGPGNSPLPRPTEFGIFIGMSTLLEIESAVATLPREQQEVLLRHLSEKLQPAAGRAWPVPPPDVPREELKRIHALIEAEFSGVDAEGR